MAVSEICSGIVLVGVSLMVRLVITADSEGSVPLCVSRFYPQMESLLLIVVAQMEQVVATLLTK